MEKLQEIHSIHTFASTIKNKTILIGKDEDENDLRIVFNTIDLLEWLDIGYMKNRSKKYIDNL